MAHDQLLLFLIFLLWLLPIAGCDLRRRRIPNPLIYSLWLVLGCYRLFVEEYSPLLLLTGFVSAALFLLLVRRASSGGMGMGDVKFAAAGGLLLPGLTWIPGLAAASIMALITLLPFRRLRTRALKMRIPFAPFMGAGFLLVFLLRQIQPSR